MSFRQNRDPSHIVLTYHQQGKEVTLANFQFVVEYTIDMIAYLCMNA